MSRQAADGRARRLRERNSDKSAYKPLDLSIGYLTEKSRSCQNQRSTQRWFSALQIDQWLKPQNSVSVAVIVPGSGIHPDAILGQSPQNHPRSCLTIGCSGEYPARSSVLRSTRHPVLVRHPMSAHNAWIAPSWAGAVALGSNYGKPKIRSLAASRLARHCAANHNVTALRIWSRVRIRA